MYSQEKRLKNNIAILGGSFNPIHNGHLKLAIKAYESFPVSKVLIIPNYSTYYKEDAGKDATSDRVEMVKLAIKDYPYMEFSDIEIRRAGVTYTIDTIEELLNDDPSLKIYFIIGGDSLQYIDKWKRAEELLSKVTILTAVRDDVDTKKSRRLIADLKSRYVNADIRLMDMKGVVISSSDIRNRVMAGISIEGLVPPQVEEYIINNGLYKNQEK